MDSYRERAVYGTRTAFWQLRNRNRYMGRRNHHVHTANGKIAILSTRVLFRLIKLRIYKSHIYPAGERFSDTHYGIYICLDIPLFLCLYCILFNGLLVFHPAPSVNPASRRRSLKSTSEQLGMRFGI